LEIENTQNKSPLQGKWSGEKLSGYYSFHLLFYLFLETVVTERMVSTLFFLLFMVREINSFSEINSNSVVSPQVTKRSDNSVEAPPLKRHKPRKICLMIEPTPFTHISGYSNRFKEMLKYLRKAGDNVEIVTTDGFTGDADKLPKSFMGYNIQHTLGFTFPLYNQITLTFDLPELKGLKAIDTLKPDLIHVTSPGFLVYAGILYSRIMRIPLVLSYHTHLPLYGRNYLNFIPQIEEISWTLIRWVHSRADLTLVTSPQIKEEFKANGISRVDVWRKGIDTVRFHPSFKDKSMRERMSEGHPDDFLMVHVGRLGAEKRIKDLKAVLDRMNNARLCIVGKGPQEDELHKYFEGTKTYFTGLLTGDELSQAFASADAFVMPSDSETLGFVVLEAMASGVPVVAARAGGIPSIITQDGETGMLVTTGDTDGYVKCLEKLQNDKSFRDALADRSRKEAEKWGWEAATSVLRNVQYQRAIVNFHSRAFGGFGRQGSRSLWRLLRLRVAQFFSKFPRFRTGRFRRYLLDTVAFIFPK